MITSSIKYLWFFCVSFSVLVLYIFCVVTFIMQRWILWASSSVPILFVVFCVFILKTHKYIEVVNLFSFYCVVGWVLSGSWIKSRPCCSLLVIGNKNDWCIYVYIPMYLFKQFNWKGYVGTNVMNKWLCALHNNLAFLFHISISMASCWVTNYDRDTTLFAEKKTVKILFGFLYRYTMFNYSRSSKYFANFV